MKITDRLFGDHKTFRRMMSDIDAIAAMPGPQRNPAKLIRIVELFKDHLVLHAWAEDNYFYPQVRSAVEKNPLPPLSTAYIDVLDQEHKVIDGIIDQVEREVKSSPIVDAWVETYRFFAKNLDDHMKKEEEELFPLSEKLLGAGNLEELSKEAERHRSEAPRIRLHARA